MTTAALPAGTTSRVAPVSAEPTGTEGPGQRDLPPAFTGRVIALSFSAEDRARSAELLGARDADADLASAAYGEVEARWLTHQVRSATVGTRLVLCGAEGDVRAAHADAVRHGMVSAEIVSRTRPGSTRRVYCPHCRTLTLTPRAPEATDSIVTCGGCWRLLEVFDHFSRRMTAYLGAAAGAEDLD
jgi:hypothetical protein